MLVFCEKFVVLLAGETADRQSVGAGKAAD